MLPSLSCETDSRFDSAGSKRQWLCSSDIHRFGSGCPRGSDKSGTARSARPRVISLPSVRFLHFPDL